MHKLRCRQSGTPNESYPNPNDHIALLQVWPVEGNLSLSLHTVLPETKASSLIKGKDAPNTEQGRKIRVATLPLFVA